MPSGAVERSAACRPPWSPGRVDGDGEAPELLRPGERAVLADRHLDHLRPQRRSPLQPARVGVGIDHAPGSQCLRARDRVQADAARPTTDHEHLRAGCVHQRRRHGAVRVRHVVGDARDGYRIKPVLERDEHGVGVRHAEDVGQRATPRPAERLHPVGRAAWDALAAPGVTGDARGAGSARDLERDHDDVARRYTVHRVADLDDLGHALVPERKRLADRDHARQEGRVEVAHRHRQRPHERLTVAFQDGCGDVTPAHRARTRDLELSHYPGSAGASRNGMTAGARRGEMKTS